MLTRLLRTSLRPYLGQIVLVVALVAIGAVGNLYLPNLNADIINGGVIKGDLHYILRTGAWMLAITLALGLLAVVGVYFASKIAMRSGADIRAAVFARVQTFSAHEMNRFGTPSLITRNTNDVQQVQIFVLTALTMMVTAPIMSIGGVLMAVHEGAALTPLLGVSIPLLAVVIGIVLKLVVPQFRSMQGKIDRINQVLREQITGVRVIRAFVRNDSEDARFKRANVDLTSTALRVNRIFALTMPTVMLIMTLSSVAVIWFGGRLVNEGSMPIGNLTAFLTYIMQILMSVMMAVMIAILAPRAVASAERILQVLDTEPTIRDPERPIKVRDVSGEVEFVDVSFGYPGSERPVLNHLNFTLHPGETSAIIGGTGSGKSTLLNLIPRFFDVSSGTLRVNGVDVREQQLEELWSTIGLVPQTAYLFRGTVADNLRFGSPGASDEELWRALEIAQARDFVASMPGGLLAPIDQGGTNVSGGQRQRLSIARALVRKPALYLFDDCFSALDAQTDSRLRSAIKATSQEAAVVIVAQRVSTIMHADRIIVLDAGTVVGYGSHEELLGSNDQYRAIVVSQVGEGAVQ